MSLGTMVKAFCGFYLLGVELSEDSAARWAQQKLKAMDLDRKMTESLLHPLDNRYLCHYLEVA